MHRIRSTLKYAIHNPKLVTGVWLLLGLVLIGTVGPWFVDTEKARPISVPTNKQPSAQYPLGTDSGGRDVLSVMVVATPQTLRMGIMAGFVGILIGTSLGLISAYYGGRVDVLISGVTDTMLTIPPLAVLLVVAASFRALNIEMMALIIASLSWMNSTRALRAQVLSLKELPYIHMSRLSGLSDIRIIAEEILPNILPLAAAHFVGAVSGAILAGIGLEVLGLGPQDTPTLGMTIYWAMLYSALIRGMWWWWMPPILVLILLFIGLFLISTGLDEFANPRLRKAQ